MVRESLDLFVQLGDKRGIAMALLQLGAVSDYRGDPAEAKRLFLESLAHFQEMGDEWGVSTMLNNLGEVARAAGDYDAARSFYEKSLTRSREAGLQTGIAIALSNLGTVSLHQGNHTEAATLTTAYRFYSARAQKFISIAQNRAPLPGHQRPRGRRGAARVPARPVPRLETVRQYGRDRLREAADAVRSHPKHGRDGRLVPTPD